MKKQKESSYKHKESDIEWIGEIPKYWSIKKYKRVFHIINGNGFPEKLQGNVKGEYPFIKVSDVSFKGKIVTGSVNYVSEAEIKDNKWTIIPTNSILLAKIGEALKKNHRKINSCECLIDNNMMALVLKTGHLLYFYYLLCVVDMNWYSNPGAVPSLNNRLFREDFCLFPPIEIQETIATFLDQKTSEIDSLITDKEKLIELLEEKRQAIITEAVTKGLNPDVKMKDSGVEWIGEIPEHWEVSRVKYVSVINPPKSEIDKSDDINVSFIPMEKVDSTGGVDLTETRTLSEVYNGYTYFGNGDIVIAKVTPCFENGNIALLKDLENGIGFGTTEFHVLRSKDGFYNQYLYYLVRSDYFMQEGVSSMYGVAGLKRIPTEYISNYKHYFPSIEEQIEIANYLDDKISSIFDLKQTIKNQIQKLKEYRQSLIYEAVTGKIDVRNYNQESS